MTPGLPGAAATPYPRHSRKGRLAHDAAARGHRAADPSSVMNAAARQANRESTRMARLNINGKVHDVEAEPDTPLLWVIREHVGLTGTKFGCGIAQCGACSVHINGDVMRSCSIPLSAVSAT